MSHTSAFPQLETTRGFEALAPVQILFGFAFDRPLRREKGFSHTGTLTIPKRPLSFWLKSFPCFTDPQSFLKPEGGES